MNQFAEVPVGLDAVSPKAGQRPDGASDERAEQSDSAVILIVSGDMDKALAALMVATGAAASGMPVTVYFAFWGITILRRRRSYAGKGLLDRMFTFLLPSGPGFMPLSRLNFLGMGRKLMAFRMRARRLPSLETLVETAAELGVRLVVCEMSMDLMGVGRDELIENVAFAGVTSFVEESARARISLMA